MKENKPKINKLGIYGECDKILCKIEEMDDHQRRAILANLRNSINSPLSKSLGSFAFIFESLPEDYLGRGKTLTYEERAIIDSLRLYSIFIKSGEKSYHDNKKRRENFGRSLGCLRLGEGDSKAIDRRFNALVTSTDYEELMNHLRQVVKLLKGKEGSQINFARLAQDLYSFSFEGESRDRVRLNRSRSYYGFSKKDDNKDKENKGEENE